MDKQIITMLSISDSLLEIKGLFELFDDPMDRFAQIIDMGKNCNGLTEEDKNDITKITGCTSQAWVKCSKKSDDTFLIRTDSDAFIVRGLLNILEKLLSGRSSSEILSVSSSDILDNIGLNKSLSSQRTNGFLSALTKIHNEVKNLVNAN